MAALVLSALLASCGDDEPQPIEGRAKEAAGVVALFERAIASRDFKRACRELFTPALRRQVGGKDCAARLRRTAARVTGPRIQIKGITLRGETADVDVTTTAKGQGEIGDTLKLVRQGDRFRIAGLGG